jgi:hypothetical protein
MRTLGRIFVILVFAAVVSVVYYWQVINAPTVQLPVNVGVPTLLTYTNTDYLFEVKYNRQYKLAEGTDRPHYFKTGGNIAATITVPETPYAKTNFGSADITFAAKTKSSEADCKTYLTSANATKTMTENFLLNKNIFYTVEFDGAAAGTHYKTKLYRVWRNPSCYEISMTVGLANIQNYDPKLQIKELTFDQIFPKLEAVANSFTFLEQAEIDDTAETGHLLGNLSANAPEAYDLTQIIVYTEDKTKIVAKEQLDNSGHYYIVLPIGTYYVTYTSVYNSFQPPMKKVVITANRDTIADFTIDGGDNN